MQPLGSSFLQRVIIAVQASLLGGRFYRAASNQQWLRSSGQCPSRFQMSTLRPCPHWKHHVPQANNRFKPFASLTGTG